MVLYGIPAMPPSIAIVTPVLGGPGTMRVVFHSSSIPRISCEGLKCRRRPFDEQSLLI